MKPVYILFFLLVFNKYKYIYSFSKLKIIHKFYICKKEIFSNEKQIHFLKNDLPNLSKDLILLISDEYLYNGNKEYKVHNKYFKLTLYIILFIFFRNVKSVS